MKPLPQPTSSTFACGGSTRATSRAMSYARPTLRRRRMRLKRRLIVVVRLFTDRAQCKPGSSFSAKLKCQKHLKNKTVCATGANLFRRELLTTERQISAYEVPAN